VRVRSERTEKVESGKQGKRELWGTAEACSSKCSESESYDRPADEVPAAAASSGRYSHVPSHQMVFSFSKFVLKIC
jgi:hypothetical protein